ncbi:Kre2p [Saccharomyces cerevisiae x Saccharomyces kudriavzevii VIN7]|uniref:Kre2p n=1 Tax=Saccharomyces cerevisiae x Saccharomyces kudriavzevii (strain VIN7) TaxID=1095631 RepID=H0GTG5_SACCK|nr:Kre2p [Saccharomyces cerevisiae x Saccharomyces kudriavzevii VIN7]
MSIFLSKRLLRYTVFVGVVIILVLTLNSNGTAQQYVSSLSSLTSSFGSTSAEQQASTEEDDAEKLRKYALDPDAGEDSEAMDEESRALKAAAEHADAPIDTKTTMDYIMPSFANKSAQPKACYVTLVRNSELNGLLSSIKYVEEKINKKYPYPWVFLNDEEFTEEFKQAVTNAVSSEVKFGRLPKEHWSYPDWIDPTKAARIREEAANQYIYGGSESYRHMCRYQSGFFWRHPLLDEYDWYWRVEPGIKLYCDINYDVFKWMQDNEKVYGFTVSIHEYEMTIRTLWKTSMDFMEKNPQYVDKDNLMNFLSDDDGKTYNMCHFWSNFEIANLNLWRSAAYREYFETLDHQGGFFYERWGDAPVHSIAAALFLPKDKIHYFSDIGYHHPPYDNCPLDKDVYDQNNCECDQGNDFTFQSYSCGKQYYEAQGLVKPKNWKKFRD